MVSLSFFKTLDMFAQHVTLTTSYSHSKKSIIKYASWPGVFTSIILLIICLVYAGLLITRMYEADMDEYSNSEVANEFESGRNEFLMMKYVFLPTISVNLMSNSLTKLLKFKEDNPEINIFDDLNDKNNVNLSLDKLENYFSIELRM